MTLPDGVRTPEKKHQPAAVAAQRLNGGVCKGFPANSGVRPRLMSAHGKGGVEQQDTLVGPALQIPSAGIGTPVSADTSLNILSSEGGILTPGFTEKASPLA